MKRYPRDLIGYGATPPDPKWPAGATIAVQFVLNYEEGGENCLLHGDASSEAFLSEIVGAEPWVGLRHANMESLYEYGAHAGFWRLHRLFTQQRIPLTVYGVASALARSPVQVRAMQDAGWEIASHGLKWIDYRDATVDEERAQMREAIRLHAEVTGERPAGWYTGRSSIDTVRLAAEEGGFEYVADSYADDLPYWISMGEREQLIVPYTLDANDMRFSTVQGFNSGDQFLAYLKDSFDTLYDEGLAGQRKMLSVGLHCRLVGRPGRLAALKRFIDYAQSRGNVWFAKRNDIARYWAANHPPANFARPSQMDKNAFVEAFGGIFEHSAWVAEGAFGLELGPSHDTATGLHNALARVFRTADATNRLDVLKAHPDLAGRLTQAKRLTSVSTVEQASAGLDALTDDELKTFSELNRAYTSKFGFPFIIAVRDHTKADIMDAFRLRIENDLDNEFSEACRQVERIAELRVVDMLPG